MPSISLAVSGQTSDAYEVGAGARVTASGSGYVEWTSGTLTDVRNGVATWQRWPGGTAGDYCDTLRRVVIRGVATGALTVTWDEGRNDPGPEGVYWQEQAQSGIRPEDFGAVGDGVADDSAALLAAIGAAAAANGGVVQLLPARTYLVAADTLTWNAHNVVIMSDGVGQSLGSTAKPATIKFASGGSYGIKIGAAANYSASMKYANALIGVKVDFNAQVFSDAGLVLEGLTRFLIRDSMLYNSGTGSRMMRLKAVWDSLFQNNYIHTMRNAGAALIDFDSYQTDTAGNCNNLRWLANHLENFDGALFYSRSNANLDVCQWLFNKMEMQSAPTGSTTANFVFDLRSCSQIDIENNAFNGVDPAKFAGIIRIGEAASAYHASVRRNTINNYTGPWMTFGQYSRNTVVEDNRHYNSSGGLNVINQSLYQNRYIRPYTTVGGEFVDTHSREKEWGDGWIGAANLGGNTSGAMIPDIASVGLFSVNESPSGGLGSVWRVTSTSQGTPICRLPMGKFRDFPTAVTMYVRARRTADGATAALQLNMNGGTITPAAGFDALPAAVTSISFDGDGTTCTASKTSHGFKVGDRIIVTGTTNYNTTANAPAQILTVADANTFTFASSVNQGAESGSAQLCPWQILTFTLPTGTFSGVTPPDTSGTMGGMGRDSSDAFRLEYGASNNQPIDVDAVAFKY